MSLLREDLLQGRVVAVAGAPNPALCRELSRLGARLERFDDSLAEQDGEASARARAPLHALVYDAGPSFGAGGQSGLLTALERAWVTVRAVAAGALIPGGTGGRVVLLAPVLNAGDYAAAARSGLENLARTLSVEWARFSITTTVIAPGSATSEADLINLVAFLVSPAGGYFSGCRFELGAALDSADGRRR